MKTNTPSRRIAGLSTLALLGLAAMAAFAPTASAHDCYSLVPGSNGCGSCTPTDEDHDHRTVGNVQWCTSTAPPCETDTVGLALADLCRLIEIQGHN